MSHRKGTAYPVHIISALKEVVDGNLIGVTLACREACKIFLGQEVGVIVNVASVYGIAAADQRIYDGVKNIYSSGNKFSSPVWKFIHSRDDNYEFVTKNIPNKLWRKHCGVVMQEGYIFNESIAKNIAVGETTIDKAQLLKAVHIANIKGFIESLPLRYNTMIGAEGLGLSTGQKQRILIARAIYKDPKILFFDEHFSTAGGSSRTSSSLLQPFPASEALGKVPARRCRSHPPQAL